MATVDDQVADPGQRPERGSPSPSARRGGRRVEEQEDSAETLLRTAEVARKLQVSTRTVLAWAQAGKLPSVLTPGGHRRYPQWGVDQVLQTMTASGEVSTSGRTMSPVSTPNLLRSRSMGGARRSVLVAIAPVGGTRATA
jgi:excisionase family DNA binding protein